MTRDRTYLAVLGGVVAIALWFVLVWAPQQPQPPCRTTVARLRTGPGPRGPMSHDACPER